MLTSATYADISIRPQQWLFFSDPFFSNLNRRDG